MFLIAFEGSGSGDPHYWTFDGRYHTFNGRGEFLLLEALQQSNDTLVFVLQGRLDRVSFWRVTTHVGFAFGHQQLAFHVCSYFCLSACITCTSDLVHC